VPVVITPIDDSIKEATETVRLVLTLGVGYVVGVPGSATIDLQDNDTGSIGGTNVVQLISLTNTWHFNQRDDLSLVPWNKLNFDDSAWPSGPGALIVENSPLPVPKSTPLTLGRWTYYFRSPFQLTSTQSLALTALLAIDDGAVIYLNGEEAYRVGMPTGDVSYITPATRTIGNAILEGPVSLPVTNLLIGKNMIAVEVHQSAIDSSDVVFDLSLSAQLIQQVPLELVDPQQAPNGDFAFNLVGTPGAKVQIEVSINLEIWVPWSDVVLPPSGVVRVSEPNGTIVGPRFYRAKPAP
jgi:hypothetical protein